MLWLFMRTVVVKESRNLEDSTWQPRGKEDEKEHVRSVMFGMVLEGTQGHSGFKRGNDLLKRSRETTETRNLLRATGK